MKRKLQTTRWAFDLSSWSPTLNDLIQAIEYIQPEEKSRLMKFYFINDFLSSLVGRLLMRKYVSQSCNLPYGEIKFSRDLRGKPYWVNNGEFNSSLPALTFNVSHQGNYVILSGALNNIDDFKDFGIGCDVMKVEYSGGKDLKEFFRIMDRKFAESEWKYINQPQFNQQQQLKAFMRHWCLKESYVKELGVGITLDLQKIVFTLDINKELTMESHPLCNTVLKYDGQQMHQWYFEEHMLDPEHCAAIAFRNFKPVTIDNFKVLQISEILQMSSRRVGTENLNYCQRILNKPRK